MPFTIYPMTVPAAARPRRVPRSDPRRPIAILAILALAAVGCAADESSPSPSPEAPDPTPMVTPTSAATATPPPDATAAEETDVGAPDEPVPGDAWESLDAAPIELTEVAAAAHDERLWVVGGFLADGSASDAVLTYDPAANEWVEGPRLPAGVHHAALVSTGDRLVLLGGYLGGGFGSPTAEVWGLGEEDDGWQPMPSLPEARGAGAAAWDGERIVFGGGVGPAGPAGDVFAFRGDGDAWEAIGEMAGPREHLAAASDGAGRTWFLGGRRGGMDTNMGRVEMVEGSEIVLLERELTPRGGVGGFWLGSVGACLVGGEEPGGTLDLVECVTDDGEVVEFPSLGVPRHGLGVTVLDDAVYAVLGGDAPGLFVTGAVERLPLDG
jgi:hypothetical protein